VAAVFVPVVLVVAALTFVAWLLLGPEPRLLLALTTAVSVLVIACPCAMGLATPTAIMVATGKGAEHGLLIKSATALEVLHKVDVLVFDKTGTLTVGRPEVTDVVVRAAGPSRAEASGEMTGVVRAAGPSRAEASGEMTGVVRAAGPSGAEASGEMSGAVRAAGPSRAEASGEMTEDEVLGLAAAAEQASEHPLGEAVVRRAKERGVALPPVTGFTSVAGQGVDVLTTEGRILLGNRGLMEARGIDLGPWAERARSLQGEGKTIIYLAFAGRLVALLAAADVLKPDAAATVARLTALGVKVVMLTGDNRQTGEAIARQAGIERVLAEVLPEDKTGEIRRLQEQGHLVAMVGDGVNDAPALAQADVGVAMGSGTDVAIEAADVTLMHGQLTGVVAAIELSRRTIRIVKENLVWAFGYNVILIPVAAGVLYPLGGGLLSPILAGVAMAFSSVSVVTNSLRLRRWRPLPAATLKEGPMAVDPVCRMTVEPAKAAAQSTYKGQTYYFCAVGCKQRFDQEPERYLAKT
jgi:Cu+-exporting ATPase